MKKKKFSIQLLQDIKNRRKLSRQLLRNLKKNMPELKKVLKKISGHWEILILKQSLKKELEKNLDHLIIGTG